MRRGRGRKEEIGGNRWRDGRVGGPGEERTGDGSDVARPHGESSLQDGICQRRQSGTTRVAAQQRKLPSISSHSCHPPLHYEMFLFHAHQCKGPCAWSPSPERTGLASFVPRVRPLYLSAQPWASAPRHAVVESAEKTRTLRASGGCSRSVVSYSEE